MELVLWNKGWTVIFYLGAR